MQEGGKMTLTEIEDELIEDWLRAISQSADVGVSFAAIVERVDRYHVFLQATEIRRRLAGWQDPGKVSGPLPTHIVCDEPIISTIQ